MKPSFHTLILAAILGGISSSLSAQWPAFAIPGAPRNEKGQVDMAGPAPRAFDGKPDLAGIWANIPRPGGRQGGSADVPTPPIGTPPVVTFRDVGAGFKEGLPFQPWALELRNKRNAANSKDNPDAHCLPMGNMQFHTHPQPRKMIQAPGVIVMLYEGNAGIRQIFTDGRPLPTNDPQPWWYGYSTGRWEGDTLVVESNGFIEEGWLDIIGSPMTTAAKTIERFRRVNYGTLEIDITVDDPKAYTRPWTVRVNQRLMPDTELIEFVCLENQQFSEYLRRQQ
jgi:hypothetical protein